MLSFDFFLGGPVPGIPSLVVRKVLFRSVEDFSCAEIEVNEVNECYMSESMFTSYRRPVLDHRLKIDS